MQVSRVTIISSASTPQLSEEEYRISVCTDIAFSKYCHDLSCASCHVALDSFLYWRILQPKAKMTLRSAYQAQSSWGSLLAVMCVSSLHSNALRLMTPMQASRDSSKYALHRRSLSVWLLWRLEMVEPTSSVFPSSFRIWISFAFAL